MEGTAGAKPRGRGVLGVLEEWQRGQGSRSGVSKREVVGDESERKTGLCGFMGLGRSFVSNVELCGS